MSEEIPTVTAEPVLLIERDARGVVTLTLNRPRAFNALSEELLDALQGAVDALQHDSAARVVVIRGAGRAFCAGHDLKEMRSEPSLERASALFERCSRVMLGLAALPQPVIARVHGIATAGGCQLVAQCDLAVAASDARLAASGINVGLFCCTPSVPLARNMPRKVALEMLLTGDFIDAATAQQWGLVNRVAAPEDLDAAVEELVQSIIAKPAAAIALGKAMFYKQIDMGLAGAYQLATQAMACNFMLDDALEGVQAFLEKRPPSWRG
jgi:enoyl-CoA hydratase/carnithine racemase